MVQQYRQHDASRTAHHQRQTHLQRPRRQKHAPTKMGNIDHNPARLTCNQFKTFQHGQAMSFNSPSRNGNKPINYIQVQQGTIDNPTRLTGNQFQDGQDTQAQTKMTKGKEGTITMYTKQDKYDRKNINKQRQPISFNIQSKKIPLTRSITSMTNSNIQLSCHIKPTDAISSQPGRTNSWGKTPEKGFQQIVLCP